MAYMQMPDLQPIKQQGLILLSYTCCNDGGYSGAMGVRAPRCDYAAKFSTKLVDERLNTRICYKKIFVFLTFNFLVRFSYRTTLTQQILKYSVNSAPVPPSPDFS